MTRGPVPSPSAAFRRARIAASVAIASAVPVVILSSAEAKMKNASLTCALAPGEPALPATFAADFCMALADAMKNDVRVADGPVADGYRIAIVVKPVNAHVARITVETATVRAGIATDAKTTESSLTSHDAPISTDSARTLAFPIGRQLGLF